MIEQAKRLKNALKEVGAKPPKFLKNISVRTTRHSPEIINGKTYYCYGTAVGKTASLTDEQIEKLKTILGEYCKINNHPEIDYCVIEG